MPLWYWKTGTKKAIVERIGTIQGERYRFTIFNLWHGQNGQLVAGPILAEGYKGSLSAAKQEVFKRL